MHIKKSKTPPYMHHDTPRKQRHATQRPAALATTKRIGPGHLITVTSRALPIFEGKPILRARFTLYLQVAYIMHMLASLVGGWAGGVTTSRQQQSTCTQ
jgi:hypothetical protein